MVEGGSCMWVGDTLGVSRDGGLHGRSDALRRNRNTRISSTSEGRESCVTRPPATMRGEKLNKINKPIPEPGVEA